MKDRFLCVMAQYDAETESKLKELQQELEAAGFVGKQTKGIPNHITLGSHNPEEENMIRDKLKKVCSETEKIKVTFNSVGMFGLKVLFISPSVSHELLRLQEQLGGTFAYGEGEAWTPHTTILIDEAEEIKRAIALLGEKFTPFSGYIENVSLYEFWPTRFIAEEKLI